MNSNPASKSMPEELPSKIHTGSLLDNLDKATQVEVLGLRCMKHPLVEATEPMAKLVQETLTKCGHFDTEKGCFVRTKRIWGKRLGPMGVINYYGYIQIGVLRVVYRQSHLVYLWFTGKLPQKKEQMDHIDGCRANDHPQNLRLVTQVINLRNTKKHINNTSSYTGVSYHKITGKYRSRITVGYKDIHLGLFLTADAAYKARQNYINTHPELGFTTRHGL